MEIPYAEILLIDKHWNEHDCNLALNERVYSIIQNILGR